MATNPHVNWQSATNEQDLLHNLTTEFIKMWGIDVKYIPRILQNEDIIFGEDTISKFEVVHDVEMYLSSFDNFEGEGDMFAKFGLEIKDRMELIINPREFTSLTGVDKPLEGDLIYFPFNEGVFEITFVEHENTFYPLGTIAQFKIQAELFQYSQEEFNTGIAKLDGLAHAANKIKTTYGNWLAGSEPPVGTSDWVKNTSYDIGDTIHPTSSGIWTGLYYTAVAKTGLGMSNITEPVWPTGAGSTVADNEINWEASGWNTESDAFEFQGDDVLDFGETNPFGEVS